MHRFILTTRRVSALLLTLTACPSGDDDGTTVGDTTGDPGSSSSSSAEASSTSTDGESSTAPATGSSDGSDSESSTAADGASSDESEGSTTSPAGLEIVGDWADEFGGTHSITETTWVTTYGRDSFAYTIDSYDNDANVAIAQSDDDASWTRYDWTQTGDGELYYCQTAFGLDSAEAAESTPAADATDPAAAGCGGFAWSLLTPA